MHVFRTQVDAVSESASVSVSVYGCLCLEKSVCLLVYLSASAC